MVYYRLWVGIGTPPGVSFFIHFDSLLLHADQHGNAVQVTGIDLLLCRLHARFGALDEEQAIEAIADFMTFRRSQTESVDAMLARYELVVYRANELADFQMGAAGEAWLLLVGMQLAPGMWNQVLQPLGSHPPRRSPSTKKEIL